MSCSSIFRYASTPSATICGLNDAAPGALLRMYAATDSPRSKVSTKHPSAQSYPGIGLGSVTESRTRAKLAPILRRCAASTRRSAWAVMVAENCARD